MKPTDMDKETFIQICHEADQELFELVRKCSGSISAEHGIGLLKKKALHFSRSPAELALMQGIKQVLDPLHLLNPGKILD
jgi:FAD/FMN-containing dehydrogenase